MSFYHYLVKLTNIKNNTFFEPLMSITCKPGFRIQVQKLDWLMECMDVELGFKIHVIVISN